MTRQSVFVFKKKKNECTKRHKMCQGTMQMQQKWKHALCSVELSIQMSVYKVHFGFATHSPKLFQINYFFFTKKRWMSWNSNTEFTVTQRTRRCLFISANDFYLDVCVLVSVGIVFTAWLRCFAEFKLVWIFSSVLRFIRFRSLRSFT